MQIIRSTIGPDGQPRKQLTGLGKYLFAMSMIAFAVIIVATVMILYHFIH